MRRLAADHDPERDDAVEGIGFDRFTARERKFEAAGYLDHADVFGGDAALAQRPQGAVEQLLGQILVKARDDDRETAFAALRRGRVAQRLALHEAATSSMM